MEKLVYVCSQCRAELTPRHVPEDDDGSARTEWLCPEHGVRATVWDTGALLLARWGD